MNKCFFLVCLAFHGVFSQLSFPNESSPFKWSGGLSRDTCAVGDSLVVRLRLAIDKDHFVYASKTSVRPRPCSGVRFSAPAYSSTVVHRDAMTGKKERVFIDSMVAVIPMTISEYWSGSARLVIDCSYQGCVQTMCFLPATDSLTFSLCVRQGMSGAGSSHSISSGSTSPLPVGTAGENAPLRGGMLALVLAFFGGLLTCLTPCVYPLIPVTIGIFGATATRGKRRSFVLSCIYVAGISVMFSTLGFIMASTGKVFGQFMANPVVIGCVVLFFLAFSISLFGGFDINLPSSLQNKLFSVGGKSKGFAKIFFMGLVAGIIAAPCTGPSLGAILTYVATVGNQGFGMLMLFSFSLGLGLPFLVLGTFSSLLTSRPKPGPWMDGVKSVLGIIMLVAALYFLRGAFSSIDRLFSSTFSYFALMAACMLSGIWIGAIHLSYHGASTGSCIRKTLGIVLVTAGCFGTIGGIAFSDHAASGSLFSSIHHGRIQWISDIDQGLQRAREMKMPAVIDFSADWCLACKELEKSTFADSLVQTELSRFICIRCDLTKDTPATKKLARTFSIRGLPVLDFYSSDGKRLDGKRVIGFVNTPAFLELVRNIR